MEDDESSRLLTAASSGWVDVVDAVTALGPERLARALTVAVMEKSECLARDMMRADAVCTMATHACVEEVGRAQPAWKEVDLGGDEDLREWAFEGERPPPSVPVDPGTAYNTALSLTLRDEWDEVEIHVKGSDRAKNLEGKWLVVTDAYAERLHAAYLAASESPIEGGAEARSAAARGLELARRAARRMCRREEDEEDDVAELDPQVEAERESESLTDEARELLDEIHGGVAAIESVVSEVVGRGLEEEDEEEGEEEDEDEEGEEEDEEVGEEEDEDEEGEDRVDEDQVDEDQVDEDQVDEDQVGEDQVDEDQVDEDDVALAAAPSGSAASSSSAASSADSDAASATSTAPPGGIAAEAAAVVKAAAKRARGIQREAQDIFETYTSYDQSRDRPEILRELLLQVHECRRQAVEAARRAGHRIRGGGLSMLREASVPVQLVDASDCIFSLGTLNEEDQCVATGCALVLPRSERARSEFATGRMGEPAARWALVVRRPDGALVATSWFVEQSRVPSAEEQAPRKRAALEDHGDFLVWLPPGCASNDYPDMWTEGEEDGEEQEQEEEEGKDAGEDEDEGDEGEEQDGEEQEGDDEEEGEEEEGEEQEEDDEEDDEDEGEEENEEEDEGMRLEADDSWWARRRGEPDKGFVQRYIRVKGAEEWRARERTIPDMAVLRATRTIRRSVRAFLFRRRLANRRSGATKEPSLEERLSAAEEKFPAVAALRRSGWFDLGGSFADDDGASEAVLALLRLPLPQLVDVFRVCARRGEDERTALLRSWSTVLERAVLAAARMRPAWDGGVSRTAYLLKFVAPRTARAEGAARFALVPDLVGLVDEFAGFGQLTLQLTRSEYVAHRHIRPPLWGFEYLWACSHYHAFLSGLLLPARSTLAAGILDHLDECTAIRVLAYGPRFEAVRDYFGTPPALLREDYYDLYDPDS